MGIVFRLRKIFLINALIYSFSPNAVMLKLVLIIILIPLLFYKSTQEKYYYFLYKSY